MIFDKFPNWDIDVEKGTIYSLRFKRNIGTINNCGYVRVKPINGYKHYTIHQYIWMVANGCDIPEGYDIHHIDGNKQNNSIYNLELIEHSSHMVKHKQNISDETKRKISETLKGFKHSEETKWKIRKNSPLKKKVGQYTLDGELVKIYDSISEVPSNNFKQSNISNCCNGKRKTHKGFIWRFI